MRRPFFLAARDPPAVLELAAPDRSSSIRYARRPARSGSSSPARSSWPRSSSRPWPGSGRPRELGPSAVADVPSIGARGA